ncbi:MAG: extracellular solute-binding protein, partial [Dehalococcoidia bacterium]|nr:extracellular solute-binding protein [Dehalococcoidia bacterium]
RRAGGVRADVILLADPTAMNQLRDNNVLSDYVPAAAANFPAGLRGNGWVGAFTFNNVIIVRQGGPTIQDWSDLTRPELRDRVMIADPAFSGTTLGMVGHLSNQLGWDYFRTLQRNGARTTQSTNTVGTEVAQGSVIAGITLDSVARDLVQRGSPVQVVWPTSGAVPVPAPVGLVRGRGESVVGRAFVDWLVSPEGQQELEKLGYVPVVGQTAAIPANARLSQVDWTRISREREQILETFRSIFG